MKQLSYSAAEIDERLGRVDKLSNPNLLINPFFQINQRGISSSSNAGYTVDGWRLMASGHMVEVMPDKSLKVTASSSAGLAYALAQYVENYSDYEGKTVTISALIEANTTTKGIRLRWAGEGSERIYGTGLHHVTITIPSVISDLNFGIQFWDKNADNGNYFIIKGMKVELGEISTLANDAPPKIATDLAECQRYFRLWKTEAARTAALNEVGLMRLAAPTLGTISIGGVTYYTASAEL